MRGPKKKLTVEQRMAVRRALRDVGYGYRKRAYTEQAHKYGVSVTTIERTVNG